MKCPFFTIGRTDVQMGVESDYGGCLEAECAWWDDTLKRCSIRIIAQFMVGIGVHIHNIAESMPFKAQL